MSRPGGGRSARDADSEVTLPGIRQVDAELLQASRFPGMDAAAEGVILSPPKKLVSGY